MENNKQLLLIEGCFNHDEGRELLFNLFNSKINYHKDKNWSSNERFGKDDKTAQERIPLLKQELARLQTIVEEAKANNKKLAVHSTISIQLVD